MPGKEPEPITTTEMTRLILSCGVSALIGRLSSGSGLWPVVILALLLSVIWLWHSKKGIEIFKRFLSVRLFRLVGFLLPVILVPLILFIGPNRYVIFGSPRLRGVVTGMLVPISDFSWATNGTIVTTLLEEKETDGDSVMKVSMALRGDKPYADAGWSMDLFRWSWLKLKLTHNPWFQGKHKISFYIRGEKGGEKVGVSMKSDRELSSPSGVASDEEKVSLDSIGVSVTTNWQQVSVPFHRFYNVDPRRIRNVAFYTDASLMKSVGDSQIIYLRRIAFQ